MHHSRPTISRVGINNVAIAGRNHHLTLPLPTFLLLEAEVGEGVGAVASHSRGAASEGGRRGEGIAEAAEEEEGVGLAEDSLIGDDEEDKGVDHEEGKIRPPVVWE